MNDFVGRLGRQSVRILILTSIIVFPSNLYSGQYRQTLDNRDPMSLVYFCDLVIRGEVVSRHSEISFDKDWSTAELEVTSEDPMPMQVIELNVLEVLKGSFAKRSIDVIVPGGRARMENGQEVVTTIDSPGFGYGYDYQDDEEYILCLYYYPQLRGGSFVTSADLGRFKRVEREWINKGTGERSSSTVAMIRSVAKEAEPTALFREADIVVYGEVTNITIEKRAQKTYQDIATVTLMPRRVFKGATDGKPVQFRMFARGGMEVSWYTPSPRVREGDEWFVFLVEGPEGAFPFGGANGMLKLRDDTVFRGNYLQYQMDKEELVNLLSKEEGGR